MFLSIDQERQSANVTIVVDRVENSPEKGYHRKSFENSSNVKRIENCSNQTPAATTRQVRDIITSPTFSFDPDSEHNLDANQLAKKI